MMILDQKKAIATIVGKRRSAEGKDMGSVPMKNEISQDEEGHFDPRHVAAQDIMAALNEKSPQKLMEALSAFHDLHSRIPEEIPLEDLPA